MWAPLEKPGMSTTLNMAYIVVPQLQVTGVEQRYTCLEATHDGGRYRYESLNNGVTEFTTELPVDIDGLVIDCSSHDALRIWAVAVTEKQPLTLLYVPTFRWRNLYNYPGEQAA